jgi:DNA-binding NarL/FixJ family response regulator
MSNQPEGIGILIADHHPKSRDDLRKVIEAQPGLRVVGEATDGEQTLELARQHEPRILLLDISLPPSSGLAVLRQLKTLAIQVHTLVLAAAPKRDQIVEALRLGACGILLKRAPAYVLVEGLRAVAAGQYWLCHESVPDLVQAIRERQPCPESVASQPSFCLTRRETEIVALIEGGYTNKEIAKKFALSEPAVKHHLTNIFDKLGVSNHLELVLFSIHHHLTNSL